VDDHKLRYRVRAAAQ